MGFPPLDAVPPVNSTLVQQWIAEVAATGIKIPNIPLSVDGSCASDAAKAANASICWWTCGGCTRNTDVTTCPDKVYLLFFRFCSASLLEIIQMTWGLTYDDGPSPYTTGTYYSYPFTLILTAIRADLLNYLDANELKTTFFVVGSRAISRPDILQAEYVGLHQVQTLPLVHINIIVTSLSSFRSPITPGPILT